MTTNNTPTTPQGKARKVFAQFDYKLEIERGAYYLVINNNITVQITMDEVLSRADEYDKQQLYNYEQMLNDYSETNNTDYINYLLELKFL